MALVGAITVHDAWVTLLVVRSRVDVGVDVAQLLTLLLCLVAWRPW